MRNVTVCIKLCRVAGRDDGGVRLHQQAELGRRDPEFRDAGVLRGAAPGGGREGSGSRVRLERVSIVSFHLPRSLQR